MSNLLLELKAKKGSKKVIERLDSFGHCISYAGVNAVETKLAMDESKRSQKNTTYVLSVITPSTFVIFIWDNFDHNCESIFGDTLIVRTILLFNVKKFLATLEWIYT